MSKIALTPNASGTGTLTIAAPSTNSDRTITLPDATTTLMGTDTSVTQAQLATALNASGSAPIYACRAWVNFNGTGTVAIRASGNVSSVTDGGTGSYTVNFTTAMPDADYAVNLSGNNNGTYGYLLTVPGVGNVPTAGFININTSAGATFADLNYIFVTVFR